MMIRTTIVSSKGARRIVDACWERIRRNVDFKDIDDRTLLKLLEEVEYEVDQHLARP